MPSFDQTRDKWKEVLSPEVDQLICDLRWKGFTVETFKEVVDRLKTLTEDQRLSFLLFQIAMK